MPTVDESLDQYLRDALKLCPDKQTFDKYGIDELVKIMYSYYNRANIRMIPDWQAVLGNARKAFTDAAGMQFNLQGSAELWTGSQLSAAFENLQRSANYDPNTLKSGKLLPSRPQLQRQQAQKKLDLPSENRPAISRQPAQKNLSNEVQMLANQAMRALGGQAAKTLSPGDLLDAFLWCRVGRGGAAEFRVYVCPTLVDGSSVFVDFSNASLKNASQGNFPGALKISVPGTRYAARIDRIVIYCESEEQYTNTIEWFRTYQQNHRTKFDNKLPAGVLPIDGLVGVGGSKQPTPAAEIMAEAGIQRVNGMSFGYSRAAVAVLALRDMYAKETKGSFASLKDFFLIKAWEAHIDLGLESLPKT